MYQDPDATPGEIAISKRRIAILRIKAHRRQMHSVRGSLQAIAAKARLITAGKGANGRSMSPALLERHMNLR